MPCGSGDAEIYPLPQLTSTPQGIPSACMPQNLSDWPLSPVETIQREVRKTTEASLSFIAPQTQFQDLSEEYVQQKKLEWSDELDKTHADIKRNLKRLRDEANTFHTICHFLRISQLAVNDINTACIKRH